jgi:DNA invertase Pin-like site-specific DNA recombinase
MARRRKRDADPSLAVGYIRVSTDEQALGPEAQREALQAWCERHGARLCATFEDIGVSGGTPLEKRTGLNVALDALAEHGAGVFLVAKRDRLARDVVVGALVERLAERVGARVVDSFAAYERRLIGARTKAALRVKKSRGERVGAIPYGHRLAKDGQNLEPDPQEQKVVKLVRRLRAKGKSLRYIADTLTRRGFETRTGGYWHVQTVSNIARI